MLPVTETAFPGVGLSVPQVVVREATPCVAIAASGPMVDLPRFAPPLFPRLHAWMAEKGLDGTAGLFRYRGFHSSGDVDLEVATLLTAPAAGEGEVIAGELPAGRYVMATYTGPYDRLYDAFCMLSGWLRGRGLIADEINGPDGRFPACQVEIYRVSPADTGEPARWETDLLLKLAD